jgi:16S rRNA (cytosine1402-N4)-methyltransferase
LPVAQPFAPTLLEVGAAQRADSTELAANPRARSAVLRVAERVADAGPAVRA